MHFLTGCLRFSVQSVPIGEGRIVKARGVSFSKRERARERAWRGRSPFSIEFWLREVRVAPKRRPPPTSANLLFPGKRAARQVVAPLSRVQRFGQPQFVLRERAELWRPSVTPTLAGAFSFSAPPFIIRVPLRRRATCAQTKSRAAHNAIKKKTCRT